MQVLSADWQENDLEAVTEIYNHYIVGSVATFEEQPLDSSEVRKRVSKVKTAGLPWLVARTPEGTVAGYCYARPWHERAAYRFSVETSLYVAPDCLRQGVGRAMYEALLRQLREAGLRTALAGVALPNEASVALHERLGFQQVAHLHAVGFKFDRWIDVGYWQLSW